MNNKYSSFTIKITVLDKDSRYISEEALKGIFATIQSTLEDNDCMETIDCPPMTAKVTSVEISHLDWSHGKNKQKMATAYHGQHEA